MGGEGTLGRDFSWSLDLTLRAAPVLIQTPKCGRLWRDVIRAALAYLGGRIKTGGAEKRRQAL